MTENYTFYFGVISLFKVLFSILVGIASIIYYSKRKSTAGVLMVIGSTSQFILALSYPVISIFAARSGGAETILNTNLIQGALGIIFTLLFTIGFLLAVLEIPKKEKQSPSA